jgi:hypothetical protein
MDLTDAMLEGWNASDPQIDNPYLWSSPSWLAFDAGAAFYKLGTSKPVKCKASRGYTLRVYSAVNEWIAKPGRNLDGWQFDRKG